jgi:hypothetical protein
MQNNQTLNFNRIAPNGITFAQFFSTAPLTGIPDYPVAFAGAGTTMAVGGPLSTLPAPRRLNSPVIQNNRLNRKLDSIALENQPTYRTIFVLGNSVSNALLRLGPRSIPASRLLAGN